MSSKFHFQLFRPLYYIPGTLRVELAIFDTALAWKAGKKQAAAVFHDGAIQGLQTRLPQLQSLEPLQPSICRAPLQQSTALKPYRIVTPEVALLEWSALPKRPEDP